MSKPTASACWTSASNCRGEICSWDAWKPILLMGPLYPGRGFVVTESMASRSNPPGRRTTFSANGI